ncbi:MAG: hypothetical protein RL628_1206 [Actinomycetota bacterium]
MALIAVTPQFPMTIIWITCTMGIYIISTMTIGMNAPSMVVLSTPNTSTNMGQIVVMLQSPTVTTSTIYMMATYTPLMATTGTNTKYSVSGRGGVRSPQADRPLW